MQGTPVSYSANAKKSKSKSIIVFLYGTNYIFLTSQQMNNTVDEQQNHWFAGKLRWLWGEKTTFSLAAVLSQQQQESQRTHCQHHHSPGMRKEQRPAPVLHQCNPLMGASSRPEIPRLCVWPRGHRAQTEKEMPAFFLNQQFSCFCYGSIDLNGRTLHMAVQWFQKRSAVDFYQMF